MKVKKRDGSLEDMRYDKITKRIQYFCDDLDTNYIDATLITLKVTQGIYDGITTNELDTLAAETAASLVTTHPDYAKLAGRLAVSNLHKTTPKKFSQSIKELYSFVESKTGKETSLIANDVYQFVIQNKETLDNYIKQDRDFDFDYFGIKTLERSYLLKNGSKIVERPQYMYMRVAVGICNGDISMALKIYDGLSLQYYTHATPTLFNAGTVKPQMSSCFLVANKGDDIDNLFDTIKDVAKISKWAGGIGLHVHDVRGKGSYIKGTGGESDGLIPMMKTYNEVARWINQGGKRKGSFAIYLEPWHSDIFDFIDLRKNHGKEEMRARDLFLAMWTPNLFMKRVEEDGDWSLFSPDEAPGLSDVYDDPYKFTQEFTELYEKYEKQGIARKVVKARKLMDAILTAQIETGTPYMLYKDAANYKSNQKNLGTIKSSNLCITGDQRVVTTKGYLTVKELHEMDEELELFNDSEIVKSSKMIKRGENEDVYKITLENGMEHKVTPYHGIPIIDSRNNITRVECKDLKIGDKIPIQTKKGLFGDVDMVEESFLLGLYQSDGTQSLNTLYFDIWENDFDLIDEIEKSVSNLYKKYDYTPRYSNKGGEFINCEVKFSTVKKKRLTSQFFKKDLKFEKGYIPNWIWSSNEKTQWSYLRGLLYADGTVHVSNSKGNPIQISYTDINIDFLKELQILFNNLGLQTSIRLLRKESYNLLPDGKGGKKYFKCKDCFRLIIGNKNDALVLNENTGFLDRKGIILENKTYRNNTKKGYKVISIDYVGKEDVFCPTIYNNEHIFISQGLKTFNCSEILQFSSPTEQAVCNLASIALPKYITDNVFNHELLYEYTYQIVKNLNNVIDLNFYPTEETKRSNMRHRPIGIGVQGLADVFCLLSLPFESNEADKLQIDIFETIYFAALTSSKDLAKENGHYETFIGSPLSQGLFQYQLWNKKDEDNSGRWDWKSLREEILIFGVRNSLLVAPMPTASCFISTGKIQTLDGVKTYREIMEINNIKWSEIELTNIQKWINFKTPIKVNTRNGFIETDKIFYNGHVETLKIEMEDGVIFECSYNHKFLINRNNNEIWVRADELIEGDDIVTV
jgi:ribonucleoside-diphosphate reductase alpha chain